MDKSIKSGMKEAATFLWISAIAFIVASDAAFPFVAFMMRAVFYLAGALMLILSAASLVKALKKRAPDDLNEKK